MSKPLEFWYALVLGATVVAYAGGCFYYFNHGADRLATLYFGCAVYAAVLARFLVARLGGAGAPWSGLSLGLFGAGLLPLLVLGSGLGARLLGA